MHPNLYDIMNFINLVHPSLENKSDYAVELRPIMRDLSYDYKYSRSVNLWDISKKAAKRVDDFLYLHDGIPVCLYYSVFTYDYDKEVYTKDGKKAKKGKINSSTSMFTEEIALDFDNISEDDYYDLIDRFEEMGIDALWVFSGHGYQAHILLDAPLYDKKALFIAAHKFKAKGFDVDLTCVDPARVMRLPFTYNNKCFVDKKYEHEIDNPPYCELVKYTTTRYSFEEVMELLDKVKNVNKNIKIDVEPQIQLDKIVYPYIDEIELPNAINKMLKETPHGYRNKTLGFLVKYFKTYLKLSKDQIYKICKVWANNACTDPYLELNNDFNRFYYHNGLPYDKDLSSYFGYIDFQDYVELQKSYLFIPSRVIDDLDGKLLKFYIAVKMLEYLEKDTTIEKIIDTLSMSERAVRDNLKLMLKTKHIYTVKGNRTKRIPNRYYTNKINSIADGYLKISYNDAKAYINELGIGELKLYLYVLYKFYSGECFMAQSKLGNNIGVNQSAVSGIVKGLVSKDYIRIRKTFITEYLYHNNYTLLK